MLVAIRGPWEWSRGPRGLQWRAPMRGASEINRGSHLAIKRRENSEQADKLANAGYKCCGRWWNAKFCFELHSHSNLMKEKYVFAQIKIHVRWTVISSSIVHHPLLFYAVYRFRSRYKIKKFLFKKNFLSSPLKSRYVEFNLSLNCKQASIQWIKKTR